MQRIVITGNSGSGKSTLALALARRTGLPVVHLDQLWRRDDGAVRSEEDYAAAVAEALAGDRWICEGYHVGTFHLRAERADTIVLVDIPVRVCLRRMAFRRGVRAGFDARAGRLRWRDHAGFLRWIAIYRTDRRPYVLQDIDAYRATTDVVILRNGRDVRRFLAAAGDPTLGPVG